MKLGIAEILEGCSKLPKIEDKVNYLRQYDCLPLRVVLQYALDYRVEWLLPIGTPPYKPTEHLDQEGNLYRNIRKVNLFVKGGDHPDLHPIKRETLFIQFLEGLAPKDAELICAVKDKKIPYKGYTIKLVNTAFPGLIAEKEI
jgi:Family of unknown function (DUF6433)